MSEEINLWTSLLQESSKRSQIPESTCIIVGDQNTGKKQLLQKLCHVQSSSDRAEFQKELISYNYFDIEEGYLESVSRVNLWSFDHHIFNNSFEIVGNSNKTDKLLFLVVVDLSKPDKIISSLSKWLVNIANYIRDYYNVLTIESGFAAKQSNVQHLKSARLNKGDVDRPPPTSFPPTNNSNLPQSPKKQQTPSILGAGDEKFEFLVENFSLPIVVVGSKCDSVDVSDGVSMRRAREVQGQLRNICLEIGAALVYCSSVTDVNCVQLKHYVSHRLYPEFIPVEGGLQIEDKVDVTFIPSGFDTAELISIASGLPAASYANFRSGFEQDLKTHAAQVAASLEVVEATDVELSETPSDSSLELETEQDWLTGLHTYMLQASATGGVAATTSSGATRLTSHASDPALALLGTAGGADSESNSGAPSPNLSTSEAQAEARRTMSMANLTATNGAVPAARPSRRQSVVKPAAAGGEDVSDFFKNLMK